MLTIARFRLCRTINEHFHAEKPIILDNFPPKTFKNSNSLVDWIYEVFLASPFRPKMSVAIDASKLTVLDHFCFRHTPIFGSHLEQRIYNEDSNK